MATDTQKIIENLLAVYDFSGRTIIVVGGGGGGVSELVLEGLAPEFGRSTRSLGQCQ
jgi:hypothetical protein